MDEAFEELIAIVELLREAEFTQFRYQNGDLLVEVSRGEPLPSTPAAQPAPVAQPAPAPEPIPAAPVDTSGAHVVEAPILGTFYRAPKPGEPPFVQVGDVVTADTVVCIVEVMKLMNSVRAGVAGTVVEILASDGELVELGTPLFLVRPES